jgi:hypothetical protein
VFLGSHNFALADVKNGETLWRIRDRRIAASSVVEAVRLSDSPHRQIAQQEAKPASNTLHLVKSPCTPGEKPWWSKKETIARKIRDCARFSWT